MLRAVTVYYFIHANVELNERLTMVLLNYNKNIKIVWHFQLSRRLSQAETQSRSKKFLKI